MEQQHSQLIMEISVSRKVIFSESEIPFFPCRIILNKNRTIRINPGVLSDLFDGTRKSDCLLPCVTAHFETKFLNKYASDTSYIDITFSSQVRLQLVAPSTLHNFQVKITTTDMLKPSLSTFLSKVN